MTIFQPTKFQPMKFQRTKFLVIDFSSSVAVEEILNYLIFIVFTVLTFFKKNWDKFLHLEKSKRHLVDLIDYLKTKFQ